MSIIILILRLKFKLGNSNGVLAIITPVPQESELFREEKKKSSLFTYISKL